MAAVRKKQDDKILKSLRELATLVTNKHCFDCGAKGVTYVNMTIGSFVCTSCSGILRGITPPHRVKSISMATFTEEEVDFLRGHGNEECGKTWLGLWDTKRALKMDHKDFMIEKYERKRYYLEPASPLKSIPSTTKQQQQQQQPTQTPVTLSTSSSASSTSSSRSATLDLKSISLTPPSTIQRQNGVHHHHKRNNFHDTFPIDSDPSSLFKQCKQNGAAAAASHNKSNGQADFVADFNKAADLFGNGQANNNHNSNGLVNGGGGGGGGSMMENFADFEHNQIYNAAEEENNQYLMRNFIGNGSATNSPATAAANTAAGSFSNSFSHHHLNQGIPNLNTNCSSYNNVVQFGNLTPNNCCWQFSTLPMQQQQQQQQPLQQQQQQCNNNNLNNNNNYLAQIDLEELDEIIEKSFNQISRRAEESPTVANNNNKNRMIPQSVPQNIVGDLTANNNNNNNINEWDTWHQWPQALSIPQTKTSNENDGNSEWSLSMNKSGGGLVNGNKSAPSADKYAALKDLDEQFREIKIIGKPDQVTSTGAQGTANPFKSNPFQAPPTASPWGVETTAVTAPQPKTNGWTNGFTNQYNNNNNNSSGLGYSTTNNNNNNNNGFFGTTNGFPYISTMMPQQNGTSSFGGLNQPNGNYNPFMTGTVNSNNPFL